jgi:hypothetical protein
MRSSLVGTLERDILVILDLTQSSPRKIDLLYSWIEMWLFRNCKSGWVLEILPGKQVLMAVHFSDVREALYFKMSPLLTANQSAVTHRFTHMNMFSRDVAMQQLNC